MFLFYATSFTGMAKAMCDSSAMTFVTAGVTAAVANRAGFINTSKVTVFYDNTRSTTVFAKVFAISIAIVALSVKGTMTFAFVTGYR